MNRMKSGVCVILAVMLIISVMALPVCASEAYSPNDTYVLDFNGTYTGAKWQYFSPYWPEFTYDGVVDDTTSLSFTLYNTVNDSVIPTYCTDLDVGLNSGSNFRRLNLEDSTYAASAAGKLRSIVNAGFPWVDVEALGAAAGVEALTVGEAVAATQAAIWQVAHGERAQFTDFCCFIDTEWNPTQTAYYEACMEEIDNGYAAAENEAKIEERISQVFDYLINLAPTAPSGVLVSNATFSSWTIPVVTANAPETEGGEATCDVTVDVTVDTAALTGTIFDGAAVHVEFTAGTVNIYRAGLGIRVRVGNGAAVHIEGMIRFVAVNIYRAILAYTADGAAVHVEFGLGSTILIDTIVGFCTDDLTGSSVGAIAEIDRGIHNLQPSHTQLLSVQAELHRNGFVALGRDIDNRCRCGRTAQIVVSACADIRDAVPRHP